MLRKLLLPDPFAVTLLVLGIIMIVGRPLRMAGAVGMIAAFAYWLVMIAVRASYKRK
jgi:hypothetical protein